VAHRDGRLFDGMMNASDKLHPTVKGYQVWADGLKPILTEILGPPAATDQAPPPAGGFYTLMQYRNTCGVLGFHGRATERPGSDLEETVH
jgi:hypothetical protein